MNNFALFANNIILTVAFIVVLLICSGAATVAFLGGSLDGNFGGVDEKAARRFTATAISAAIGIISTWTAGQYSVFCWILFLVQLLAMTFLYQKACKT